MNSAARFLAQFFPLFLLGALVGKLMEDSGSVSAIAGFMTERLGPRRAVLAVVLAGALVTSSDGRDGGSSPRGRPARTSADFRAGERSSLFASMSDCDLQTRRKCAPSLGWKN
jgi:GntP family permease